MNRQVRSDRLTMVGGTCHFLGVETLVAGFYDVYVLAPARTSDAVEQFLTRFVPVRETTAADYPVPYLADVSVGVFGTASEIVAYCVAHPAEPYAVYWRSLMSGNPFHAMVFFTSDGGLLLGLSVTAGAKEWLTELMNATNGTAGWIGFEEPPPDTVAKFKALIASSTDSDT